MTKIDKDFPLPRLRETYSKYSLDRLEVNDSIFYPKPNAGSLRTSICSLAKRTSRKFITRLTVEDGVKGLRVWRIK